MAELGAPRRQTVIGSLVPAGSLQAHVQAWESSTQLR